MILASPEQSKNARKSVYMGHDINPVVVNFPHRPAPPRQPVRHGFDELADLRVMAVCIEARLLTNGGAAAQELPAKFRVLGQAERSPFPEPRLQIVVIHRSLKSGLELIATNANIHAHVEEGDFQALHMKTRLVGIVQKRLDVVPERNVKRAVKSTLEDHIHIGQPQFADGKACEALDPAAHRMHELPGSVRSGVGISTGPCAELACFVRRQKETPWILGFRGRRSLDESFELPGRDLGMCGLVEFPAGLDERAEGFAVVDLENDQREDLRCYG